VTRYRSALLLPVVLASGLAVQGCAAVIPAISALGSVFTVANWMDARMQHVAPANGAGGGGPQASPAGATASEAESYRQGIRDTLEQFRKNGGVPVVSSPTQPENIYYVGPVMQEVWVPAQVVNGMVVPAHRQWVLVRPGQWQTPGMAPAGQPLVPAAAPAPTPRRGRGPAL
jgi:hypothetical protein